MLQSSYLPKAALPPPITKQSENIGHTLAGIILSKSFMQYILIYYSVLVFCVLTQLTLHLLLSMTLSLFSPSISFSLSLSLSRSSSLSLSIDFQWSRLSRLSVCVSCRPEKVVNPSNRVASRILGWQ